MAENTFPSAMAVYDQQARTGYLDALQNNVNLFNDASQGTILLDAQNILGNFNTDTLFHVELGVRHRDVESDAKVGTTGIYMSETVGVKLPWTLDAKKITDESLSRAGYTRQVFSFLVGQRTAEALSSYYVEHALKALLASSTAGGLVVKGDLKKERQVALNKAIRLFGDKAERIKLFVMSSNAYNDLVDTTIASAIYQSEGIVLREGTPGTLGRPVLVTDKAPDDKVFALQPGAVKLTESSVPKFVFFDDYQSENFGLVYRGEGNFNLELLGYSYDKAQGANPKIDVIASAAAWKPVVTSKKLLGGAVIDLAP